MTTTQDTKARTNADKLVALVTELCDNVRDGLLSSTTAADAIAAAGSTYVPDPPRRPTEEESRERATDLLLLLEMPQVSIEYVLDAARAQGEVMTVPAYGSIRVTYRAGVYTVTP